MTNRQVSYIIKSVGNKPIICCRVIRKFGEVFVGKTGGRRGIKSWRCCDYVHKDIKLGICPIGWTNDDMWDLGDENTFQQCISEMRLAGFTGCEIGHKYPSDVKELKEALDLRGMTVASKWFSSFLGTKPFEETFEEFKAQLLSTFLSSPILFRAIRICPSSTTRLALPMLSSLRCATA